MVGYSLRTQNFSASHNTHACVYMYRNVSTVLAIPCICAIVHVVLHTNCTVPTCVCVCVFLLVLQISRKMPPRECSSHINTVGVCVFCMRLLIMVTFLRALVHSRARIMYNQRSGMGCNLKPRHARTHSDTTKKHCFQKLARSIIHAYRAQFFPLLSSMTIYFNPYIFNEIWRVFCWSTCCFF